jgi:hypothetical protein
MRIWLAIRVFFRILFDAAFAGDLREMAGGKRPEAAADTQAGLRRTKLSETVVETAENLRNDAITLLAALQREARFVDMIKEPLGDYTDAQVGAAARDVLRDCRRVVDRLFGLRPLVDQAEGSEVEVPAGYDPGRYRVTGEVAGAPPFRGRLVHHGWMATQCELPTWSGSAKSIMIVAPEEVEVK